jgi:hypothetical protein
MKCDLLDLNKIRNHQSYEEMENELKESKKILTKLINGKSIETGEMEILHQTIESLWYAEKQARGSW